MRYHNKTTQYYVDPKRSIFSPSEEQVWVDISDKVGHLIERQFIDAINQESRPDLKWPDWYVSARLATRDKDHRGIDIVVQTKDLGCFFVQVKSSRRYVTRFLLKSTRTRIAVVVIEPKDTAQTMRRKFFQAARLERQWLKKRRSGERPPKERTVVW
ncbi:MAG: hypothetical protein CEO19_40 [Parcubacteria group bacterium Gr01-1014_73]|nr:MAG: hypothetical protein CEO19_40 [Parcubacteria group bacterium Gr01-1014_73]